MQMNYVNHPIGPDINYTILLDGHSPSYMRSRREVLPGLHENDTCNGHTTGDHN